MIITRPFRIEFSDIALEFDPQHSVQLPEEFLALLTQSGREPDAVYQICPLMQPLSPEGESIQVDGAKIYPCEDGQLRIYSLKKGEKGEQVACHLLSNDVSRLYFPASAWNHYTSPVHCSHLIGIETVLLRRNSFLLHSSVVQVNGKAILFSGPSGAGKSTQAELWKKYMGADILNGDRCVIMKRDDGFYGGGSPIAGHSRIYRREQYPIAGIFLIEQSTRNCVERMGIGAFRSILTQSLVNSWDISFMEKLTGLVEELLISVPVYRLSCLADQEAVELAYNTIFIN